MTISHLQYDDSLAFPIQSDKQEEIMLLAFIVLVSPIIPCHHVHIDLGFGAHLVIKTTFALEKPYHVSSVGQLLAH